MSGTRRAGTPGLGKGTRERFGDMVKGEIGLQKRWVVGSLVAFGMGICFVGGHKEIWLETSFQSECIVF